MHPPGQRLLPATCGNGVRIDGSRSAAPASSLASADTGTRPSESCPPPTHSPCVPASGQCTASWPHGSRSPGTSPDPQRSPPVPAPGRAAPASPQAAAEPPSTVPSRPDTEPEPKEKPGTGSCSPPPEDASPDPDPASQSRRHDREAGACPPQTADSPACDPDDPAASSAGNSRTDAGNPAHDAGPPIPSIPQRPPPPSQPPVPAALAPSTRTLWRNPDPSGSYAAVSDLRFPFSIPAASAAATRCHRTPAAPASVVYKFICKNEKRTVTTNEWLESDVLSGMWRCLDAESRPGTNHS